MKSGGNAVASYGAKGRRDALMFDPEQLTVVTDPKHPLYDERVKLPIDEAIVRNIMRYGVKQSITVRKNGDDIEVVDGRQRVRCAIEANKRLVAEGKVPMRVPALADSRGEDSHLMGVMVSLNENRRDDGVLVKARKAERMLSMGASEEEVGIAFGVTRNTLVNWKQLVSCSSPVQRAVEQGVVSASIAKELHTLSAEKQKETLDKMVAEGATKGTKSIRTADHANGKTRRSPSMVGRREVERLLEKFEAVTIADLPDARKVLRYVLGNEDALAKKWLESAEG